MSRAVDDAARRGRGATGNLEGRYERLKRETVDDGWTPSTLGTGSGWGDEDEGTAFFDDAPRLATTATPEHARKILSRNNSPDLSFELSINPYQGCEHGCIYCFARPTHAYWNLSPGLDFETKLFYKADAAKLLAAELGRAGHRVTPINLGSNTDPYQPLEREHRITRGLLEVLLAHRHPLTIITKGVLILRDLDLLAALAAQRLVSVSVSLTTLDSATKRTLEPRTASGAARLRVMRELSAAGVPVQVNASPMIPFVNDHELEHLLEAAWEAGARRAATIFVRLPHEVAPLFRDWLAEHYPDRAERVMHAIQSAHGGSDYRGDWGRRFTGSGPMAMLLQQRFVLACRRLGFATVERFELDCTAFRVPAAAGQGSLF